MVFDYEVVHKVWEGLIPVEIAIDEASTDIKPLYMMLPRCSYLGLQLPKVIQFFASNEDYSKLDADNVWFESMGQPLKSYYPVGILYDMYDAEDQEIWSLTLKIGTPPIGCQVLQKDALESIFIQSVKEADYLKRKAEVITSLRIDEMHRLWNGVVHHSFDDFWAINRRLMDHSEEKQFLHIPIRFYTVGNPFRQVLVRPITESEEEQTLEDALKAALPNFEEENVTLISHGISLPPESALTYLAHNFSYPDNFVHVVVKTGIKDGS